jgi:hypothetical protein
MIRKTHIIEAEPHLSRRLRKVETTEDFRVRNDDEALIDWLANIGPIMGQ